MTIFGYTETRRPRRLPAGVSDQRQTRATRRVTRANSKKVAPTRPEVPPPFPYIYGGTFLHELRTSQFWRRCELSSTTKVSPSDL